MKKIGLTQRIVKEKKHGEIRDCLDFRWYELLHSIDLVPISVPSKFIISSYDILKLDGIILTGGNDLASQADNPLSRLRDKHEKSLIKYSINNSIPILGVCRGMQLIGEYFGSTLKKVEGHIATRHKIASVNHDKYIEYINKKEYVNSYHAYSIDAIGDDLNVVGICPEDDVIEAIVHKEHKIFGQMWHPERESPFEPNDCDFIYSFFNA
jgi:N5-(cytidine 5'-diphosphoramidyl)-L-glutamine hydrolase